MTLTTVIIDDEKPARDRLKQLLREYPFIDIIGEAENGIQAVEIIDLFKPGLVFLDIQMPGFDGFQVIKRIKTYPNIIFVTAYDDYAIEAFEVNAVDYLLKPFSKQRLRISLNRIFNRINKNEGENNDLKRLIDWYNRKTDYLTRISFKVKNVYRILDVEEIFFFKLENGMVYLYGDNIRHQIEGSLGQLEKNIDPSLFFRANRNSIINIKKIQRILPWGQNRFAVEFPNNERIVISRDRGKLFKVKVGLRLK